VPNISGTVLREDGVDLRAVVHDEAPVHEGGLADLSGRLDEEVSGAGR
jgi:hypothetical protein